MDFDNSKSALEKEAMSYHLPAGSQSGLNNGLRFLIDVEAYEYYGSDSTSNGLLVAVHHPLDVGITSMYGIDISPGSTVQV